MPSRLSQNETITSIGETLASARRDQKLTIKDAEQAIKIRSKYITALEKDAFDQISGEAYVIGFIQTYAQWLDIDPLPLVDAYKKELGLRGDPKSDNATLIDSGSGRGWLAPVAGGIVILVFAGLAIRLIVNYF